MKEIEKYQYVFYSLYWHNISSVILLRNYTLEGHGSVILKLDIFSQPNFAHCCRYVIDFSERSVNVTEFVRPIFEKNTEFF